MKRILAGIGMLWWLAVSLPGHAWSGPPTDANGAAPRPFYIVGHNPNTLAEVIADLAAGANALEPDITWPYTNGSAFGTQVDSSTPGWDLVMEDSSFPNPRGTLSDTHFKVWLQQVHDLVKPGGAYAGKLALITFDIKSSAATASVGPYILGNIRSILNTGGVDINVSLSVGTRSDGAVFDNILPLLGAREGVQIDSENNVNDVVGFFESKGYTGNLGYGDGTSVEFADGYVYMDRAAFRRSQYGVLKVIPYVFTVSLTATMQEYITTGVDGMIPSDSSIASLAGVVNGRNDIRLATHADNPFQPKNESYSLYITTANGGVFTTTGTDANLTFTLNGANGSSTRTVDASRAGRMEDSGINYVTIPSRDLGALTSISIYNDNAGSGPDWRVASIQVASARWLGTAANSPFYLFNTSSWVNGGTTVTFPLTPLNSSPAQRYVDAWVDPTVPAANTATDPTGEFGLPWQQFFSAYNYVRSGGTIHLGGGTYAVPNQDLGSGTYGPYGRIDKPGRIVKESTAPYAAGNARLALPSY